MVEGMAVTNISIMIISTIVCLLSMLIVSSWTLTPVICEPYGTEELRRGAMDKVLATIGCE
ncbi:hypothetical protein, partial [Salmonella enterica]|uniref:hypothetical protein n=1 Tax=Salmonella enterica TaxID=28901 RepID=UPI003F4BE15E